MRRFFHQVYELLEMIKVGHSVLALPFAFMGAMLAARGLPAGRTCGYILLAMVGARSAAMGFNRLVDARIDAINPRTADRALPAGRVSRAAAIFLVIVSSLIFILAAGQLNRMCLILSPLVLAVLLGYSYTKRFTAWSHLVLGFSLGMAPMGGWLAVRGYLGWPVVVLGTAVVFWVAGFDILYALQDEEFDRRSGLLSIPARWGAARSRRLAALCHLTAALGFATTGYLAHLGAGYAAAVLLSVLVMLPQHLFLLFRPSHRLSPAFFTLNGLVGLGLVLATWFSLSL